MSAQTCPDCYGVGVLDNELCPLCRGRMTPAELAERARINATERYRWEATYLMTLGDKLAGIDHDGAYAMWCDAMKALDAAMTTEDGLKGGS